MTRAFMIEYERGWGAKVDEVKEFPTRAEAVAFADEYNRKYNNEPTAPDWYIRAEVADRDNP